MTKVLLVEDDDNLRGIYGDRMAAEGYEIISARDGEEALAMAVNEKPDLIISDVMMPKISGFDMLDILRSTKETKDTKVIMMTALSQKEDQERGKALGANRYLVKSQVTLEDVVRVAAEVLSDDSATASSPGGETMSTAAPAPAAPAPDPTPPPATPPATPPPTTPPASPPATPPAEPAAPAPDPTPPPATPPAEDPAPKAAPAADKPEDKPATPPAEPVQTEAEKKAEAVKEAASDPALTTAPTADEEKSEVDEQIDDYADKKVEKVAAQPPVDSTATATVDDPDVVEPPADEPEAPAEGESTIESASVGGNKVIEPINDPATEKPDINQLYKEELARENQAEPGKKIEPTKGPAATDKLPPVEKAPPKPAAPGSTVNPNDIAL